MQTERFTRLKLSTNDYGRAHMGRGGSKRFANTAGRPVTFVVMSKQQSTVHLLEHIPDSFGV
jgi:hypothetical protein